MTDDFKNFIKNYDKSGKGAERKKREIIKDQPYYGFLLLDL